MFLFKRRVRWFRTPLNAKIYEILKSTNIYSSESPAIINNEIHPQNADNGPATLEGPEWRGWSSVCQS